MRIPRPIQMLLAGATTVLLVGCAVGSVIAPKPSAPRVHALLPMGRIIAAVGPLGMLKVNMNTGRHFKGFDNCPQNSTIIYVSDFNNSVIDFYAGPNFTGQAPCGMITSSEGLSHPQGMVVKSGHLYVANSGALNVMEFSGIFPIKKLTDPSGAEPVDVAVSADDPGGLRFTIIASNIAGGPGPSISTWNRNGRFEGNFPMPNAETGLFVTVQKNNTIYYNDIDATTGAGALFTGNCLHGACGAFTATGATTNFPGGLRSTRLDTHVTEIDQNASLAFLDYTSFPSGFTSCAIPGSVDPVTDDINFTQHHLFWADAGNNTAGEMTYPGCVLKGTVQGNPNGLPIGAAIDRSDPVKQ